MIDPKKDLAAWLNQEPSEEDLSYNEDGSVYQSIDVIKPKLDIAFPGWQTKNFQHTYLLTPYGTFYCSGSVELIIDLSTKSFIPLKMNLDALKASPNADIEKIMSEFRNSNNILGFSDTDTKRNLVGAATFNTEKYFNTKEKNNHWAAVCLSLAIVNAAQNIAPFFGKNLNKVQKEQKKDSFSSTLKGLR